MGGFTIVFTHILLNFSVLINNDIETFIDFSLHLGDLGINYGLPTIEDSFVKLGEENIFVRRVYGTCVCHTRVPVVGNKFSLRIDT